MSNSWRITTILDNRSQKVLPSAGNGTGATVVRSERSLEEPVLFARGETQRILNLLGEPTKDNPELLEAIEYNKSYPLWIASPSFEGTHSTLLIGPNGSESVIDGFPGHESLTDLSSVTFRVPLTTSDESLTCFGQTNDWDDKYKIGSMKFYLNGEEIDGITNTDDLFTGNMLNTEEDNLYVSSTGDIVLTFLDGQEPTATDELYAEYQVDLSLYYCMFTTRGAGKQYLKARVIQTDNINYTFELNFQNKNSFGKYNLNNDSPVEFSLKPGHTNGFGQNIDIYEAFKDHDFFIPHVQAGRYDDSDLEIDFENDEGFIDVVGGARDVTDLDVTTGYEFFKLFRTYQADIFFDATLDPAVSVAMSNLRNNYHPYSRFLLPVKNVKENVVAEEDLAVKDRGFCYFWGWFEIMNPYSRKGNVVGTPMGEIAKNYADSWTRAFGGLAVAWTNENGVGGQLTSGRYIRSIHDPSEDNLKNMDEARINPVIYDPSFGAMIVSRRTSIAELSDYSFSDYSMIIDYILKNISSQVLPYQIVKMNDVLHRNIVRTKTEAILQPMTVTPLNVIDSYFVRCDSTNNNDLARSREEFRLDVAIRVTPKSRLIVLTFINTPQTSTVEAMFE